MPGEGETRGCRIRQGAAGWVRRELGRDGEPQGLGETQSALHRGCAGLCSTTGQLPLALMVVLLPQLVPKFCEYWYEQVLREGASSLDSGSVSLQLSDSFSLFELIEQYNMQLD